jgi:flagellar FliJ protein
MSSHPKRSERLGRVANIAHTSEQSAARRLAEAQHLVNEGRRELEELKRYQGDYTALLQAAGQNPAGSIASLRNHRAFLTRLVDAVEAQQEKVRQAEQQYSLRRDKWLGERARAQALNKVVEQHRSDENRAVERRENREQDDRAQRAKSLWTPTNEG